jgi:hypothetical protein
VDDLSPMRVMAAAFPDAETATSAEAELRERLDVGDADIALAQAGGDVMRSGRQAVLAGRFREHRRVEIQEIVEAHGGMLVDDLPEARSIT